MTPQELNAIGPALYGARWTTDLARAMGVTDRAVRRWQTGHFAISAARERDIRALLRERHALIYKLLTRDGQITYTVT